MYIDTHFHLFVEGFDYDPKHILKESILAGVKKMWLVSTNEKDIFQNIDLSKKFRENVLVFTGFHPEDYLRFDKNILIKSLKEPVVAGIGEIGIDLYHLKKETLPKQREVFESQLKIALEYNLPVSIHSRNSKQEVIEVLKAYKNIKFVWHSYNLLKKDTKFLLKTFDHIYFGFNAVVTYKSGLYIKDSLKIIPKERMLLETDAPFLAPRPFKYKYNTPLGVISVYNYVSDVLNIDKASFKKQIYENALEFLK